MSNCDAFTQRCGARMSDFNDREIEYILYARSRRAPSIGLLVTLIWVVVILLSVAYTDAAQYLPTIIPARSG